MAEDNPDLAMIPPELEAEMTPAVKAFVLALIARVDQLEKQVADLTGENKGSRYRKVRLGKLSTDGRERDERRY